MDLIQEAIEYIESREPGASFSYRKVAKKFNIDRTTLSRRHQGFQRTRDEEALERQLLNPQHIYYCAAYCLASDTLHNTLHARPARSAALYIYFT